jgi:hypothetical protein
MKPSLPSITELRALTGVAARASAMTASAIDNLKTMHVNPLFVDIPSEVVTIPAHLSRRLPVTHLNGAFSVDLNIEAMGDYDKVIEYLHVEKNPRYAPRNGNTYCNVYTHDFAEHMGAYVPRVWWTKDSVQKIMNGETVQPVYGKTVTELNANALYEWLRDCTKRKSPLNFGWHQVHLIEANAAVTSGTHFGVICARRRDRKRSGHITVILPGGIQSQAGRTNKARFSSNWYDSNNYDAWGVFIVKIK